MTTVVRWAILGLLLALRVPSLTQPIAADQSLYIYIGQVILQGGAPYVDAWDQKPPGVHLLYAVLWWLWPDERVVNVADLAAAAGCAWLLVVLGRRLGSEAGGWLAAWIFALLGNPAMHRLGGVFQRGQCETFIALAVTGALVVVARRGRGPTALTTAGLLLGCAIWLKYNAAVFVLPIAAVLWTIRRESRRGPGQMRELAWVLGGAASLGALGLGWLAWHGALTDLWLATFAYNVEYSSSAFDGPTGFLWYVGALPIRQARHELLWLLGLGGVLFSVAGSDGRRALGVTFSWIAAAVVAIGINGRDLPQYFVQATPALALAAGFGLVAAWQSRQPLVRLAVVVLALAGLIRVGVEPPVLGIARFAGLPGLAANIRFDLDHWRGGIDRRTYLARFGGQRDQDKYSALDVADLSAIVATHTGPGDHILVFGFSPGVLVQTGRLSATRFFWSRPVIIEFAAGRPGYGSAGLLEDLQEQPPTVVALQKADWDLPTDSYTFFTQHPVLGRWLETHYAPLQDSDRYSIWRRGRD